MTPLYSLSSFTLLHRIASHAVVMYASESIGLSVETSNGRSSVLSLALQEPRLGRHAKPLVGVVEGELLERRQRQSSVDDAVVVADHHHHLRVRKRLREAAAVDVHVNGRAHRAAILHHHHEPRRLAEAHLRLLHPRLVVSAPRRRS